MNMGDCIAEPPLMELEGGEEGEEDLIAAAHHILKALKSNRNLTDEAKKILANLGSQLSNITSYTEIKDEALSEENEGAIDEIELQLSNIQDKIVNWEKGSSMIWDYGPEEGFEYLKAVDEVRRLTEMLENRSSSIQSSALLCRAHDVLQASMARLEEEFVHLLVQNRQPFEPERMSFRSSEEDSFEFGSIVSFGEDSFEDVSQRDSMGRNTEEYLIELVNPDVIPDLKGIANLMFDSGYGQECSQAFINVQKDALDDCLFILEVEKSSIEDVLKMEWNALNSKIRRWVRAMKVFVRVYLASGKLLTEQIFGELESVSSACFVELSKPTLLQLLNFAEAISVGPHTPEKLIRVLDMYEILAELIPDILALYSEEEGSSVRNESQDILRRLGDCAKGTFLEFKNLVDSNVSANAFSGGGVHPLTRYVLNYIKALMDYRKSLDKILKDQDNEKSQDSEDEIVISPVELHFRSLVSILESNLEEKSKLYKDEALQHIFLMNNTHYMAERVKASELRTVLGDEWIRKHNWKFQQHAMSYERATWSSIMFLLREEGIQNPGSNSVSRSVLKERLQRFYLAFEEVYKSQTGWSVPDIRLRDDLRISTSLKVIQGYRTFVGRHINHVSEKHIKYNADDLEDYLLDLFEGSQKSLHGGHRR